METAWVAMHILSFMPVGTLQDVRSVVAAGGVSRRWHRASADALRIQLRSAAGRVDELQRERALLKAQLPQEVDVWLTLQSCEDKPWGGPAVLEVLERYKTLKHNSLHWEAVLNMVADAYMAHPLVAAETSAEAQAEAKAHAEADDALLQAVLDSVEAPAKLSFVDRVRAHAEKATLPVLPPPMRAQGAWIGPPQSLRDAVAAPALTSGPYAGLSPYLVDKAKKAVRRAEAQLGPVLVGGGHELVTSGGVLPALGVLFRLHKWDPAGVPLPPKLGACWPGLWATVDPEQPCEPEKSCALLGRNNAGEGQPPRRMNLSTLNALHHAVKECGLSALYLVRALLPVQHANRHMEEVLLSVRERIRVAEALQADLGGAAAGAAGGAGGEGKASHK